MTRAHLLVKVDRVVHESGMVDEVEARPVLRHVTLEKQLLSQLDAHPWMKHSGVPQAVDHDDDVVVELAESLAADVKGLLRSTFQKEKLRKWSKSRAELQTSDAVMIHLRLFYLIKGANDIFRHTYWLA